MHLRFSAINIYGHTVVATQITAKVNCKNLITEIVSEIIEIRTTGIPINFLFLSDKFAC